jgi:hypothetical protein
VPRLLRQEVQLEPIHFARVPLRVAATRRERPDEIAHSWASPSLAAQQRVVVLTLVWRLELEVRQPLFQGHDYYRMP